MLIMADSFHKATELFAEFAENAYGSGYDRYSFIKSGNRYKIKAGRDLYCLIPIVNNSLELLDEL